MNHYVPVMLAVFLFPAFLVGQSMEETNRRMSAGNQNAFVYTVEGIAAGELEDVLKDHLKRVKTRRNPKYDRRNRLFFLDDGKIPSLSNNTIDVYATIETRRDETHDVIVWFDLGGAYLNSEDHPEAVDLLEESWFEELSAMAYDRSVTLELEAQTDLLDDLNKNYDRLQKEQNKLQKLIEDCQARIAQAEADLESNAAEQQELQLTIQEQQSVVEAVKKKFKKN